MPARPPLTFSARTLSAAICTTSAIWPQALSAKYCAAPLLPASGLKNLDVSTERITARSEDIHDAIGHVPRSFGICCRDGDGSKEPLLLAALVRKNKRLDRAVCTRPSMDTTKLLARSARSSRTAMRLSRDANCCIFKRTYGAVSVGLAVITASSIVTVDAAVSEFSVLTDPAAAVGARLPFAV
ncbi:hypothetical protein BC831DRAFT_88612 [Entophlyctis helioformis]|nr:hypothetical protein BC831DRAFT_88612 [Entophlyctis helioformis]